MKKFFLKASCLLSVLFIGASGVVYSQEEGVSNAFLDLLRSGTFQEGDSPMRKVASEAQMSELFKAVPQNGYFCFTEDRMNSIRVFDAVPLTWLRRDANQRTSFKGDAAPGEIYLFQVGVLPVKDNLNNLKITFSDLKCAGDRTLKSSDIICYNISGVDLNGKTFTKNVDVKKDQIQPLWVGIKVPASAKGLYAGKFTVTASNAKPTTIDVAIDVKGDVVDNNGTDDGWRMSRLSWLNSTDGLGTKVTAPYIPVSVENNTINYLGGDIEIGKNGLPVSVVTNYNAQNELDKNVSTQLLAKPISFTVETDNGIEKFSDGKLLLKKVSEGRIQWTSSLKNTNFTVDVNGFFEFDGFSDISVKVTAKNDVSVKDIKLDVPYNSYSARYVMGLGLKGGYRKDSSFKWNWDTTLNQDAIWMGNVNSGLKIKLRGDNYSRQLVNIYYSLGKLNMPKSWGNDGKGGVDIKESENEVNLTAYSGRRVMRKGETLNYQMEFLLTPVKPLDMKSQDRDRYFQSNSDTNDHYIQTAKNAGANIINVHSKKDIYPFINYPYYDQALPDLKKFISDAHKEDLKVKVYYTTRELTVKIPDIWALRTFDSEIIKDGPGKDAKTLIHPNGPDKWLVDNFKSNFIPAWYNAFNDGKYKGDLDISVLTNPDSRWNNYYLAGLQWMVKNLEIDGVYIDDSALDRESLKRARRILDLDGKPRSIDIHSWNHMNEWACYANSLMLYTDLFPYIDRLWIGEGFGAYNTPDFWLVEMSGIPFGVMSETLDSYNYWRGMIYGMTPRLGWSGDPVPMWRLMDDFGFGDSSIYGFWNENAPVKVSNENVRATTYLKADKALVVLANWTDCIAACKLEIDEAALGFKPSKITVPEIKNVQWGSGTGLGTTFSLDGKKGLFIIIEKE